MKHFKASKLIHATPEKLWGILTDASQYTQFDPNMDHIEGKIALGEKITVHTKFSKQAFPVTVSVFDAPRRMLWGSGMPLGLFKGEREFTLQAQADGQTQVTVQETFTGLLLPIMGIPDLSQTFQQFVDGLKDYAEK